MNKYMELADDLRRVVVRAPGYGQAKAYVEALTCPDISQRELERAYWHALAWWQSEGCHWVLQRAS